MIRSAFKRHFSRQALDRDLRTAVVALCVATLVMATPSLADMVTNADKVDGKDAVGAGASIAQRRGKLVATNRQGRLPNNIITKVPDADRLDGLDSRMLTPVTAAPQSVQTGVYGAFGSAGYNASVINFRSKLPGYIGGSRYSVIPTGGPFTVQCPAIGQVTEVEWLCIYQTGGFGTSVEAVGAVYPATTGASSDGFYINFDCGGTCFNYGVYAVRAPAANQPPLPRGPGVGRGTAG